MSTSHCRHSSFAVPDVIDEQLGMLPSVNLGPPIRASFADRVFRTVEKHLEHDADCSPPPEGGRSSAGSQFINPARTVGDKTISSELGKSSDPCRDGNIRKSANIGHQKSRDIRTSKHRKESSALHNNDEFNSRKVSKSIVSSKLSEDGSPSLEQTGPSESKSRDSNPRNLGSNRRVAPPIKLPGMTRWELDTVEELREIETELCRLHMSVVSDNGRNYKRLIREYKGLQGKLMSNHGYMVKELDLCSNWELKAFSGAFGWCLKTSTALKKLKLRRGKYFLPIVVYITEGRKEMRRRVPNIAQKRISRQ